MKIILPEQHIALTSANEVEQLIAPLRPFGINHLVYVKAFKDGSHINLSNYSPWTQYFYENECYQSGIFEGDPDLYQSGNILWNSMADQEVFHRSRSYFNIDYGVTIVQRGQGVCEFFYIGARSGNPALINFYLNNMDLLQQFTIYFREQGQDLLKKAAKQRIRHPNFGKRQMQQELDYLNKCALLSKEARKKFLKDIQLKRYCLDPQKNMVVSGRELECLKHLSMGKTAEEIGKDLFISRRTVETHLENLKSKCGCRKRSDLIRLISEYGV